MGKYKDLFSYLLRMFSYLFQSQQYAAAQGLAELCKDPKYIVRVRNTYMHGRKSCFRKSASDNQYLCLSPP